MPPPLHSLFVSQLTIVATVFAHLQGRKYFRVCTALFGDFSIALPPHGNSFISPLLKFLNWQQRNAWTLPRRFRSSLQQSASFHICVKAQFWFVFIILLLAGSPTLAYYVCFR